MALQSSSSRRTAKPSSAAVFTVMRLVDLVGDEVALVDRLLERVAEGRLVDLEEAQRVLDEGAVLGIGQVVRRPGARRGSPSGRAGCRRSAQRAAPLAVDAAVAFVGDDQVEVAGRELGDTR